MSMRTIIAGNWKMNRNADEAAALIDALLADPLAQQAEVELIVAPAFPFLTDAVHRVKRSSIKVAAQNCHGAEQGAFTGEVSVPMLKSIGVGHCIVGHSERRQYFGETDASIGEKVRGCLDHGVVPIFCCGENKEQRISEAHFATVAEQFEGALRDLTAEQLARIIIAYEPVWAIGTGLNATPEQAQDMHAHIRSLLRKRDEQAARTVPILYGGSCKPDNAEALFAGADVNGGLIGGASLVADQFLGIARIAQRTKAA